MNKVAAKKTWPIRHGEGLLFSLAASFSFGAVALAIFFRTWSDTLFLTYFSVDQIPIFYIWSAFAFAPVTMLYTWLSHIIPPVKLNTITLLSFALLSSMCASLPEKPLLIFIILLLMSLVSPLVNAICWSVILERLDSLQSKRLIPLISSASTIGAICAGGLAAEVIEVGGLTGLITLISFTLIGLATLPRAVLGAQKQKTKKKEIEPPKRISFWSGLSQLRPLMQHSLLAITMIATLLMAITTNLVDYLFKAEIQQNIPIHEIGPFLARFHAITNLLIFLLQIFVLNKLTQRLGLKWAYSLYPSSLFTVGAICLTPLHWFSIILLRGVDTLMKFTVYTNTENLILTPVPFVLRTQVKVLLKGAIYPLGGLIAGLLITLITTFSPQETAVKVNITLGLTLALSTLWIYLTRSAQKHYLAQLARNLKLPISLTRFNQAAKSLVNLFLEQSKASRTQEDVIQLLSQLKQELQLESSLEPLWLAQSHTRADLIEWLEHLSRASGITGFGERLETYQQSNSAIT